MEKQVARSHALPIQTVDLGAAREGYVPATIQTPRGTIESRFYRVPRATRGTIWASGAGGDWGTPGRNDLSKQGIYPNLCEQLQQVGIASLWIKYRQPAALAESVDDVLTGIDYLNNEGIGATALVGWSFGGAVVIRAAALSPTVHTVVTLATQSYGADVVKNLPLGCSILLIHGSGDTVLPPSSSEYVYRLAHEPKELLEYEGAGHGLGSITDEVEATMRRWIIKRL